MLHFRHQDLRGAFMNKLERTHKGLGKTKRILKTTPNKKQLTLLQENIIMRDMMLLPNVRKAFIQDESEINV